MEVTLSRLPNILHSLYSSGVKAIALDWGDYSLLEVLKVLDKGAFPEIYLYDKDLMLWDANSETFILLTSNPNFLELALSGKGLTISPRLPEGAMALLPELAKNYWLLNSRDLGGWLGVTVSVVRDIGEIDSLIANHLGVLSSDCTERIKNAATGMSYRSLDVTLTEACSIGLSTDNISQYLLHRKVAALQRQGLTLLSEPDIPDVGGAGLVESGFGFSDRPSCSSSPKIRTAVS